MSDERWIVGPEDDQALYERLGSSLRTLGYRLVHDWSGVGGSQAISHWDVSGPAGRLVIEAETYVGLSVSGPAEQVSKVRKHFSGALPANGPNEKIEIHEPGT